MKDSNNKIFLPTETIHKDVVIIGNGPSGITLSYMLAGHWPYWIPEKISKHPDELLRARLTYAEPDKSLVEQDLVNLADGLEGRSTNPVSLLLDSLQNPCADLGMDVPSMLQYKYHPHKEIDHVVLGKGEPGGSWHRMDPNLRTLSLSSWMSLPGFDFHKWDKKQRAKLLHTINQQDRKSQRTDQSTQIKSTSLTNNHELCNSCKLSDGSQKTNCLNNRSKKNGIPKLHTKTQLDRILTIGIQIKLHKDSTVSNQIAPNQLPRRLLSVKRKTSREVQTRALVSSVAAYYENYVKEMNLERYFRNNTIVTAIKPIHNGIGIHKNDRWLVNGINSNGKSFTYICRNVVLANGASDLANRLGLRGENLVSSWIKHDLPQLESALGLVPEAERSKLKPVLIVGAGLSAADAVTICRSSGVSVIHVYRNRSAGLDKMLPETVYPEYHEVHKMMKDYSNSYYLYTPLPEHTISNFFSSGGDNKVTVQHLTTGETRTIEVSFCAILIGFRPDLRFLSPVIKPCGKLKHSNYEKRINCEIHDKIISSDSILNFIDEPYNGIIDEQQHHHYQQQWSVLGKKINWLKNLCAKCKHLNLCEWSRRNECYRKLSAAANHRSHIVVKQLCVCNNNNNNNINCQLTTGLYETQRKLIQNDNLSAIGFGEDATKPIDCKTNPIAVDKFTNEVIRAPKGLFSMGPLVGDNFIRFIPGGALAITSALHKEND